MDPNGVVADDVKSNVSTLVEGTAPVESGPVTLSQGRVAREAFLHLMNSCYSEFVHVNPNAPPSPSPSIPQSALVAPLVVEMLRREKPPVDRIRKQGAEEFRVNIDDDPERAEFWLENTIRKRKEFLKLKQGRMTMTEYEREFVRLSKYARECVSAEAIMCKRFEDGLNEDIRLLVCILELNEFVVLVERACKAEELAKEKREDDIESRDSKKDEIERVSYSIKCFSGILD
ncbi:Retrotransposon gag domain-containing 1 [Gossypium australe]|uniref:Retrotransposon gag domain-containing 1 n=1 Tax=Gossypium australe TaxID=47621 RepID=A0A5B6WG76_9ROSI|nr:Retrotransposon gag domain-containing 1 [Gossypium australe]